MAMDIYAEVTGKIVGMLEQGVVPRRSPILGQGGKAGWPKNLASDEEYRGVNTFLLAVTAWCQGYSSAYWLTFNQAKAQGGSVRKGQKSSMVVFWKQYPTTDKKTGEATVVPVLRYYNVFNVEQCEGIPVPDAVKYVPTAFSRIEACEKIVCSYEGRPEIKHAGQRAYYTPTTDAVTIPAPGRFRSGEEYYGTLFHELAHSTGHSTRLDRELDSMGRAFGSPDYAREELVAEMASAFLCGHAGISPATVENSAAYIQSWIKSLRGDKRLAVVAAGAAQRAADWVRGHRGTGDSPTSPIDLRGASVSSVQGAIHKGQFHRRPITRRSLSTQPTKDGSNRPSNSFEDCNCALSARVEGSLPPLHKLLHANQLPDTALVCISVCQIPLSPLHCRKSLGLLRI